MRRGKLNNLNSSMMGFQSRSPCVGYPLRNNHSHRDALAKSTPGYALFHFIFSGFQPKFISPPASSSASLCRVKKPLIPKSINVHLNLPATGCQQPLKHTRLLGKAASWKTFVYQIQIVESNYMPKMRRSSTYRLIKTYNSIMQSHSYTIKDFKHVNV